MQYGNKLAAGAAWIAAKLRAVRGVRHEENRQQRGDGRRAALAAGQPDSAHPYLLLLPPTHPRG